VAEHSAEVLDCLADGKGIPIVHEHDRAVRIPSREATPENLELDDEEWIEDEDDDRFPG
jgi:hypothetical protein